jgi:hypothetical protein
MRAVGYCCPRRRVSELRERLWEELREAGSKSGYEIVYLFVHGIAERLRQHLTREGGRLTPLPSRY